MTSKLSRVSGYNPRFVVWWRSGASTPTTVTFPTRRLATRTRQQLYTLRRAMHLEDHFLATIADRGEIILRPVDPNLTTIDDPHTLTIRPVNYDLNTLLDDAGIHAPAEPSPTSSTPPSLPTNLDYATLMKGQSTTTPDDTNGSE